MLCFLTCFAISAARIQWLPDAIAMINVAENCINKPYSAGIIQYESLNACSIHTQVYMQSPHVNKKHDLIIKTAKIFQAIKLDVTQCLMQL